MTGLIKHKNHTLGAIAATSILLVFCRLSTNFFSLSLSGTVQFLIASAACILCFLISEKHRKIAVPTTIEHSIILLLLASIAMSLLNANHLEESVKRAIIITAITIFAFSATCFSSKPNQLLRGLSIGVLSVNTISILYSIIAAAYEFNFINLAPYEKIEISIAGINFYQEIAHRAYENNGTTYYIQRYSGIFPNPNGLGLISAIGFGLSYCLGPRKIKLLFQFTCLVGLALSVSRMGMLLFLMTLIYYNLKHDTFRRLVSFTMIVGLLAFLLEAANTSDLAATQATEIASASQHELLQLSERRQMFAMAWRGFQEHWLIGVGYGVGAEYLFGENSDTQAVHSVFLNALLETGIVGTIFLISTLLLPIFTTKFGRKNNTGPDHQRHVIAAVLFGIFFAQAFDLSVTRFHYIHVITFLLIGIWSALGRNLKNMASIDAPSSETHRTEPKYLESSKR